ncbi:MAG TPA: WD40 repeat domain-containing protein, partial [Candidatus Acidoferrales bacterium]|nr:WD40 repeat domain-containing protein [Candidatus Acidoferrales bacterium]
SVQRGHDSEVWCAAFSPDGNVLASGGKDQKVMLWMAGAHTERAGVPNDNDFPPLLSPDGNWIATIDSGSGASMLWNVNDASLAAQDVAGGNHLVGFSRDGKCVATAEGDRLEFWHPLGAAPERNTPLQGLSLQRPPFAFSGMSPDEEFFFGIESNGVIRVWNADDGRLAATLHGPAAPIRNAALSPHGRSLAVCVERENFARLFDCASSVGRELAGHRDFVSGVAFSPDGALLATGSMDGTIRLWKAPSGEPAAVLPGHMQETTDVAFSPDGRTLASIGLRESLKLWHLPTLREVVVESQPRAGRWLRFAANGAVLAAENGPGQVLLLRAPAD